MCSLARYYVTNEFEGECPKLSIKVNLLEVYKVPTIYIYIVVYVSLYQLNFT